MIHLTRQEQALFSVLEQNRGRVVPREELMEQAWGYPGGRSTRTLDVHIQHLRKKLGTTQHIETIYRIGYRLAG